MLEVTARLPGRSVFLAGESIECVITFSNTVRHKRREASGSPPRYVAVASRTTLVCSQLITSQSQPG